MKQIINLNLLKLADELVSGGYISSITRLRSLINLQSLGCSLIEVNSGNVSCPFHNHYANDELFYILSGKGKLRYGNEIYPLCAGDLISCPAGGIETAHQIINDSTAKLSYLAISTMNDPDVVIYPDSERYGVFVGSAPGGDPDKRKLLIFSDLNQAQSE